MTLQDTARPQTTPTLTEQTWTTTVRETVCATLTVTDAAPQPTQTKGKMWLPQVLDLRYERTDGGGWYSDAKLSGPRLKQDGTPGQQWYDSRDYGARRASAQFPQWAVDAIAANEPPA